MPRMRARASAWIAVLTAPLIAGRGYTQEAPAVPAFAAQAEAITVDVVVVDRDGRPVNGLEKSDFTLLEDGKPQAIVGFEPCVLEPAEGTPGASAGRYAGVASNETAGAPGRTLAFVIDDAGILPVHMAYVQKALSTWLEKNSDPRDHVTLLTTSGDAWWSAQMGRGRDDLLAILGRIRGRKESSDGRDWMSDWEASRIDVYEDATGARVESTGATPTVSQGPPTTPPPTPAGHGPDILGRVVDRFLQTGACASPVFCPSEVRARANLVRLAAAGRTQAVLRDVQQLSKGLAGARGRKSIIIVSDGFLRDPQMKAFDQAIDASQRGNTAVYFVDARALEGPAGYGADLRVSIPAGDLAIMGMEHSELEAAGTAYVASETGGTTIRNTNDLLGGLERVANESSAYYLLGYQPEKSPDGKWHKLEVKVDRKGVSVRARRGYLASNTPASAAPEPPPAKKGGAKGPTRPLDPAATVASLEDAIPVRLAPYVLEAAPKGMVRVLAVLEIDTSRLSFEGAGDTRKAALDLTVVGVSRDQGKLYPVDERLQIDVDANAVGGWFTLSRQLELPPGVAQVRALVREVASGRAGSVAERLEVPQSTAPRLSTPFLTDRVETLPGGQRRLAPLAHRGFKPRGHLYCAYDVYGLTDSQGRATLQVSGSYTLQAADGRIVSSASPTMIAVSLGGSLSRTLVLPLDGLAAGEYEITLDVVDNATGRTLTDREHFSVESIDAAAKGE
jgi:VWFA-related protein